MPLMEIVSVEKMVVMLVDMKASLWAATTAMKLAAMMVDMRVS